ncbi:9155_t:CDS:1, partial [Acaulospora colombiana]
PSEIAHSRSPLTESINTEAECLIKGMTLVNINPAINIEANGSKPVQPNFWIKTVDTITPIDPSVSANMCR